MGYLFDQLRRTMDPFLLGYSSSEHLQLAMSVTDGMAFPYAGGGVILQRRPIAPTVGVWSNCGFARPGELTISQMPGFGHDPDSSFQYRAAQVLGNGYASDFSEPLRVDFDGAGELIPTPLPNPPRRAVAAPIAAGKFLICFEYDAFGHGAYPKDFQVFGGATAVTVDWGVPLVDSVTGLNVVAATNRVRYEFTSAAFADGIAQVFGVRARNADAVAEKNTDTTISKTARTATVTVAAPFAIGMRMTS